MSEEDLFQTYEAKLRANQALDHAYWGNPNPTAADRAAYYARQELIARLRAHFYAEVEAKQLGDGDSHCATIGK